MQAEFFEKYTAIHANGGYYEQPARGLIAVWGKEAVQFLNGMITNDVAKLESYRWMNAAFPNAQGRLLAIVRVLRFDEKFYIETEAATREKVFQNLFRFTFAGDFFVEDLSEQFACVSVLATNKFEDFKYKIPVENNIIWAAFDEDSGFLLRSIRGDGFDVFLPKDSQEKFIQDLSALNLTAITEDLNETFRIENGLPLYGVDMDETTIVPEIDLPDLISYNKGCYIGQEIVARIYFRGHVAKKLTGLIFADENAPVKPNDEIKTIDGKNAGKITSVTFSPKLGKKIALAFVRYDFLAEGTNLIIGEAAASVKNLPFIE